MSPDLSHDLFEHQADELHRLLHSASHFALLWEMGVGKTPVTARLFWGMRQASAVGRLLYLCPASVKAQAARELRRWGPPGLRVQILQTRADRPDPAADAVVVNYDLLLGDTLFARLLEERWLLLVLDESHLLRTPTATRTRRVLGNTPCLAESAQRVIALTGTPVVNSPLDLFALINRLFPRAFAVDGRRMQMHEFIDRYCIRRRLHIGGGHTIEHIVGGKNLEELRERLAPYVSRLRRADVLDLPPLAIQDFALSADVDDAVAAAMAELPPGLVEALQGADDDTLPALLRRHAAELATLRRLLGTLKAGAAAEHIAERLAAGEDRAIGFFHHRDVGDIVLRQLRKAGIAAAMIRGDTSAGARVEAVDALTSGDARVLLLQNHSGSLGLNLQVCRYAAVVESDWTDAIAEQSIGRIYRAGQLRAVTVEFLFVPGTLDEHVVGVARRKARLAADLIERKVA
jgi:SWI/SNF-related matrix-associated actin-dependent regulator 1 of chromatin subfamily A